MDLACLSARSRKKFWFFMESQDATAEFLYKLWPQIEANKNRIVAGVIIVVVAVAGFSFYSWHREQNQIAAGEATTQAMLNIPTAEGPSQIASSYLAVANDYPNTAAGTRSLLQGAAALFSEGKYTDARGYFQQYLDAHPDDVFSAQAALGVAKSYEAEGKTDQAVGEYQHIIQDLGDPQAQSQARFAMAQIHMQDHKYAEAMTLFQQVAQSDPYGALGQEAAQYAYELRSKVPSQPSPTPGMSQPSPGKSPATPFNLSH